MTCRFAHDDAAYVLGALAPGERLDFERHLADCDECTRAVRALAGLPGLLGRVDAQVLEQPPRPVPVPDTMLPALTRAVRRGTRRRTFAAAGLAAAAAASVALLSPSVVSRISPDDARSSQGTTSQDAVVNRQMSPVGDVPVQATIGLERVTWGTRLLLTCTYQPKSVEYAVPAEADYTLYVRTREGRTEQVGSWRSVSGAPMHVAAATAAAPSDIASVEVRTTDGRVVLRLAA
jgi:hypothetical protein